MSDQQQHRPRRLRAGPKKPPAGLSSFPDPEALRALGAGPEYLDRELGLIQRAIAEQLIPKHIGALFVVDLLQNYHACVRENELPDSQAVRLPWWVLREIGERIRAVRQESIQRVDGHEDAVDEREVEVPNLFYGSLDRAFELRGSKAGDRGPIARHQTALRNMKIALAVEECIRPRMAARTFAQIADRDGHSVSTVKAAYYWWQRRTKNRDKLGQGAK